jgi:hypothetical protein
MQPWLEVGWKSEEGFSNSKFQRGIFGQKEHFSLRNQSTGLGWVDRECLVNDY